ncbi:DUF397 domain-containing protein [Nocardia wallacei]|uniref:DUF397 domain-containing protein n=1 Tax=Nocardia wallacei TaxID=480035 RepID=UPI002454C1BE|nr:DUF397 domain-containing protein [Nocardia wallacei]
MFTGARRAGRRKSTYSDHANGCVAVDFLSDSTGNRTALIEVTDTKLADSPAILFTPAQWSAWQNEVASDRLTNANGCVEVTVTGRTWHVAAVNGSAAFVFDEIEWTAFRKAVLDNEFAAEEAFARA